MTTNSQSPHNARREEFYQDQKEARERDTPPIVTGLVLDVIGLPVNLIGILIALGAITLPEPRAITLLIALVTVLVARSGILSFFVPIQGLTDGAKVVWGFLSSALTIITLVGVIRALVVLLT